MKGNAIVSFERTSEGAVKKTARIRRRNVPGIIERIEIQRAEDIEADLWLRDTLEKRFGYPVE